MLKVSSKDDAGDGAGAKGSRPAHSITCFSVGGTGISWDSSGEQLCYSVAPIIVR